MVSIQKTVVAGVLAFAVILTLAAHAQIRYSSGLNAAPVFEGWQKNSDGSISMVFGYLNRNFEEQLDVPVGADNLCDPAPTDCGQPTHFLPRRQRFVFSVKRPADWPKDRKLLWVVTSNGKTDTARGSLVPEMEIDNGTISENAGIGILSQGNRPPTVVTGSQPQTVILPSRATISVMFTDDGIPKPPGEGATAGASPVVPANASAEVLAALERRKPGVRIRWVHYRGPGNVEFEPQNVPPVYGKPAEITSNVRFSAPGTYVLRAIGSDSQLEAAYDATVTVKASASR